jgi:SET domain-containing protein
MLEVETYLRTSPINGIGLFSKNAIPKGTIIWRFREGFDTVLNKKEFDRLPKYAKQTIIHYMFYSNDLEGYVIMPDDARFFNHSTTPNTKTVTDDSGHIEPMTLASRDILTDEEITSDYYEFDGSAKQKLC